MGGVIVLLLAEVRHRKVGQQVYKAALGLGDQGVAVGQEEIIFHPAVLEEHLHQGDNRPGLTGAGGHHQKGLPVVLPKGLADSLDSPLLIVSACDIPIHLDVLEACPHGTEVK